MFRETLLIQNVNSDSVVPRFTKRILNAGIGLFISNARIQVLNPCMALGCVCRHVFSPISKTCLLQCILFTEQIKICKMIYKV